MMVEVFNMVVMIGQQVLVVVFNMVIVIEQQVFVDVFVQEFVLEVLKRRKRKFRVVEFQELVEFKKFVMLKKFGKFIKLKEKQEKIIDVFKVKRKVDCFNGVFEVEFLIKIFFDILIFNLDIVIIGINLGLMVVYKGYYYFGFGNYFWKCLFMLGLSEVQLNYMDDYILFGKYGIGFINMVEWMMLGSKDLFSKEFWEGGCILVQKLQKYQL